MKRQRLSQAGESPRSAAAPDAPLAPLAPLAPRPQALSSKRPGQVPSTRGRQRVRHACQPCRHRKAKCDEESPECARCKQYGIPCYYADGKREKRQRENRVIATKASLYEELLQGSLPYLDIRRRQVIQDAISQMNTELEEDNVIKDKMDGGGEAHSPGDEWSARGDAGSPRASDRVQHNKFGYKSEGFLGKASVARWLEDADQKMAREQEGGLSLGTEDIKLLTQLAIAGSQVSSEHSADADQNDTVADNDPNSAALQDATYLANSIDLSSFGASGEGVNQMGLPPRGTADALLECFFTTIHLVYPVVLKPVFMRQYRRFWASSQLPHNGLTWLAMLNMMLAIGVIGMGSASPLLQENDNHHLIYFVRARLLHPDQTSMLALPTIEHVQLSVLSGMYFAASYQINRAWHVIGSSVRCAQALALHLIDDTPDTTDSQRELNTRIWHSICALELFLSFLSGRPAAFDHHSVSTPMPLPIEDDSAAVGLLLPSSPGASIRSDSVYSNSMSMLRSSILLDKILADTMHHLYSASTVRLSWGTIQKHVSQLNSRLANWRSELPSPYSLDVNHENDKSPLPEKMFLALRYFSTSMMINRPCLCELKSHHIAMPSQSKSSKRDDDEYSALCVSSAMNLLRLFPEDPDVVWLFQSTPWWCVLHYIIQAGAILVLEISFGAVHVPESLDETVLYTRNLLAWLQSISETGAVARRAWAVMSRLLTLSLLKIGKDPRWLSDWMPRQGTAGRGEGHHGLSTFEDQLNNSFVQPLHEFERDPMPFIPSVTDASGPRTNPAPVFPIYDLWASQGRPTARPLLPIVPLHPREGDEFGFDPMMEVDHTLTDQSSPSTNKAP